LLIVMRRGHFTRIEAICEFRASVLISYVYPNCDAVICIFFAC
jgi:hypothetical protein